MKVLVTSRYFSDWTCPHCGVAFRPSTSLALNGGVPNEADCPLCGGAWEFEVEPVFTTWEIYRSEKTQMVAQSAVLNHLLEQKIQ